MRIKKNFQGNIIFPKSVETQEYVLRFQILHFLDGNMAQMIEFPEFKPQCHQKQQQKKKKKEKGEEKERRKLPTCPLICPFTYATKKCSVK
jgi:hypothetical protein